MLPSRYPYLSEFQRALALDPGNLQLLSDVAYQRGEAGPGLAARRSANPNGRRPRSRRCQELLGLKSLQKGLLGRCAEVHRKLAHEADPSDYEVMLKLGWAFNLLKDDEAALHWFDLARHSPDPVVADEATKAYRNLAPEWERFRTTFWMYPIYSSRWQDLFGYAQAKTELRLPGVLLPASLSFGAFSGRRARRGERRLRSAISLRARHYLRRRSYHPLLVHGLTGWFEAWAKP